MRRLAGFPIFSADRPGDWVKLREAKLPEGAVYIVTEINKNACGILEYGVNLNRERKVCICWSKKDAIAITKLYDRKRRGKS